MVSEHIAQWARMVETKDLSNPTLLANVTEDVYGSFLVQHATKLMLGYLSQTITRSPYGWKGPVGWGGPSSESLNEKLTEFSRQGRKFDGYHKMKTEEYLEATVRSREYKYVKGKGFEKEEQRPVKLFLFSGVRADYNIPDGGKDWEVRYAHPITTEDFSTVGIDRALEEVDFKFRDINKELEEIAKTGSFLYNAKTLPLEFTHTHFERTE